jgi:hypothetical protein
VAALLLLQFVLMARFLRDPTRHAVWYSGFGVPLFVLGMLASALAVSPAGVAYPPGPTRSPVPEHPSSATVRRAPRSDGRPGRATCWCGPPPGR